jgi:hypothetical protein
METWNFMKNSSTPAPMNDGILRDAPALDFPDWSGMLPHRSRMTFEEAVRWNDEMLSLFPAPKKSPKLESQRRCNTEFVL